MNREEAGPARILARVISIGGMKVPDPDWLNFFQLSGDAISIISDTALTLSGGDQEFNKGGGGGGGGRGAVFMKRATSGSAEQKKKSSRGRLN